MREGWIRHYIGLAFGIDRTFREQGGWYVDCYYGPEKWEIEGSENGEALLIAAEMLADTLHEQGFASQRTRFLEKQVRAMATVCRRLGGESMSFEEEVEGCFDIQPRWTPEAQFQRALDLYDEALPGSGPVRDRFTAWQQHYALPPGGSATVKSLMDQTLEEVRRRTETIVDLPAGETVETEVVTETTYGAANWYLGEYRSRMELNPQINKNLVGLPYLMCHEGYPGHHTEAVMKEQVLVRERGYLEHSVAPVLTPQLVIAEGIATVALEMVFRPAEVQEWVIEHILPQLGVEAMPVDIAKVYEAEDLLQDVPCNAAFMLHEGRTEEEVIEYLLEYTPHPEERARQAVTWLQTPLMGAYVFSYSAGKRLMQPLLQGPDRLEVVRRFLTEQLSPSDLAV